MKNYTFVLSALFSSLTTSVLAQHADVRPSVVGDQIHIDGWIDESSTEIPNLRVFGYDFGEEPGQPYFAQDPGFNASAESGLPPGSQLLFNIVGSGALGLPANLSYWDGSGDVEFGVTPADETLTLNFGSQDRVADSSTSFVAGFSLQTVTASGAVHRHLNAFLNGGTSDPTAGIYLVPLELGSSDPSIEKSLPFFIVYNNGLDEELHDLAMEWVEVNLAQVNVPGDFDDDGDVDGRDFLIWQRGESPNPLSADDLADWQANYGVGSLATSRAVPEPSAICFSLIAATLLGLRRNLLMLSVIRKP